MDNTVEVQELGKVMITPKGEYSLSKSYEILDAVSYNGSSYVSKINDNTSVPTSDAWQLLAQKGDIYDVTEEDLQRIAEQITNNANSAFNQNANSKTEAYNTNATEKLDTYNSNHTAKLKEYNNNATSKLSAYNANTVTKTTEYNSNHTNKINTYNTNASNKVDVYNTNADTRFEEYNTNADNKIAEYDEHSKELNNKIVSTRNELERLKSNVLNTGEDTDTFIHLEDSAMAEMQEIKVDGVLQQETTTGKNLINIKNYSKNDSITILSINNREIRFTTSSSLGYEQTIFFKNVALKANKTYTAIRTKSKEIPTTMGMLELYDGVTWKKVILSGTKNSNTFTVDEDGVYQIRVKLANANQDGYTGTISNIMISEVGGDYEPYTGGQPSPNPDYPQEIKTITNSLKVTSCGKSLFNVSVPTITRNGITVSQDDNGIHVQGTSTNISNFLFPTKILNRLAGKTITLTCADLTNSNIQSISFKSPATNTVYCTIDQNVKSRTYKLPIKIADDTVFSIYILSNMTINSTLKIQVEIGNKSEYENYVESQIQAKLQEGEFIGKIDGTYKDTLRAEYFPEEGQYHLMLDKKVGKYVYTGNEEFVFVTQYKNIYQYYFVLTPCKEAKDTYKNYLISNYFRGVEWQDSWLKNNTVTIGSGKRLFIYSKKFTSINNLKNFLSTNAVEVYYPLETPYTVDLDAIDMPMSYKDITNIFTDSDLLPTINAKYYRVFDKTIQNAQINEKTLKQEITDLNATVSALDTRLKALETKTVEEPTESEGTV